MSQEERERKSNEIFGQAMAALAENDVRYAKRLATELRKLGNSGSYDIEARALWQEGMHARAISTLEQGVKAYPEVAILWSLLGEYLSNTGQYRDAKEAFEASAKGHGANRSLADYNVALVNYREGEFETAILKLNLIPPDEASSDMAAVEQLRAYCLLGLGRHEEALVTIDEAITLSAESDQAFQACNLAVRADARFNLGQGDLALDDAWSAIKLNKSDYDAARVLRAIHGKISPNAKEWRILIKGQWHEPFEQEEAPPSFYATYFVVAETPEQALEFAIEFEPEPVRASCRIETAKVMESSTGENLGVLKAVAGYTFVSLEG